MLGELTHTLAYRIGRYLEGQGLLERDAENSYLVGDELDTGPMAQLQGASITYRVAVGRQQGRKVFTLQTLPLDFIARLAALVPKPRVNLTRFHGVFAPNSKHRARVTPAKRGRGGGMRGARIRRSGHRPNAALR